VSPSCNFSREIVNRITTPVVRRVVRVVRIVDAVLSCAR
jgi:hypothetical protein